MRTGVEEMERGVVRPNSVSIEVRRASWDRLWQILLQEPPSDDAEQLVSQSDKGPEQTNDAAPGAAAGKEVTKTLP
jgi:hypothetical protein